MPSVEELLEQLALLSQASTFKCHVLLVVSSYILILALHEPCSVKSSACGPFFASLQDLASIVADDRSSYRPSAVAASGLGILPRWQALSLMSNSRVEHEPDCVMAWTRVSIEGTSQLHNVANSVSVCYEIPE